MSRTTNTIRTTTVRYTADPLGRARENPPHLGDLRAFVAECEGLPDDLPVRITDGHLNESGRHSTLFEAVWREVLYPMEDQCVTPTR